MSIINWCIKNRFIGVVHPAVSSSKDVLIHGLLIPQQYALDEYNYCNKNQITDGEFQRQLQKWNIIGYNSDHRKHAKPMR